MSVLKGTTIRDRINNGIAPLQATYSPHRRTVTELDHSRRDSNFTSVESDDRMTQLPAAARSLLSQDGHLLNVITGEGIETRRQVPPRPPEISTKPEV